MTDDLVTFIRARLDEDEDYARQAFADHNEVTPDWTEVRSGAIEVGEHEDEIITFDSGISRHMVRHDPARVLRGVEAKRRIVELHEPVAGFSRQQCTLCVGCWSTEEGEDWPCRMLCLLASEWSTHPDYRQEWSAP